MGATWALAEGFREPEGLPGPGRAGARLPPGRAPTFAKSSRGPVPGERGASEQGDACFMETPVRTAQKGPQEEARTGAWRSLRCCLLWPGLPPITPAGTWQRPSHKVTKHSVRGWRPGSPTSFLRCPLARPTPSGSNSQSLVHPRPAEAEGPHPPPKSPPQAEGGRLPGGRGPGAQPGGGEGGQRGAGGGR